MTVASASAPVFADDRPGDPPSGWEIFSFHVYLTADHGNVEAVGQGRPKQGVSAEIRGERVRTYRSESLAAESAVSNPNSYRLEISGLPSNFLTLFAGGRTAFIPQGEQAVVHGGLSLEELLVPFIKVSKAT
jgi:hypothetical protein